MKRRSLPIHSPRKILDARISESTFYRKGFGKQRIDVPFDAYCLVMSAIISSKEDYLFFLAADEIALDINKQWPHILREYLFNDIWHFQRLLRKVEYFLNCRNTFFRTPFLLFAKYRLRSYGARLGFEIPPNVFGPGLGIAHRGTLIVNRNVRVGENCRIHTCTYLATQATGKPDDCPTIGNNVYIGPCTVIAGKIQIADNIAIGANSYVASSFSEEGITIAGAPAKKVSENGSYGLCRFQRATEILRNTIKRR
jgi:serine O-acetyltransferase